MSMILQPQLNLPPQPAGYRHRFHAMVKPTGSTCNLACAYCYYADKNRLLGAGREIRMSDEILEQHIRQYIEAQTGDEVVFSWQGGEPTLLGISFFQRVIDLQGKYKKPGQRVENDLQTNGLLIDKEWAHFLKKNNFLVGLSIDGPQALHDANRVGKDGAPTHGRVLDAARLLERHQVPFCALCVVSRANERQPLDVYRFLTRELRSWRIQFIPCVEPACFSTTAPQQWDPTALPQAGSDRARPGSADSFVTSWSVDPDNWGWFLSKVWDEWYRRDFGKIHIDLFETAIAQSLGWPSQRCVTAEFCGKGMAIEHNGDVFACDHYVYPAYRAGNILTTHWCDMAYSDSQKRFALNKRDSLPQYCRECDYLQLCWGECPKNRFIRTPSGEAGLNYLCSGLKTFFHHIRNDMPEILAQVKASHAMR